MIHVRDGAIRRSFEVIGGRRAVGGLSRIVARRNQITAEFLAYLAELDERQIFLDRGFASLFEYCVVSLRLCESTAGRHIAAARVCRKHPEVFALVASGALHASALSLLRKHLTPENAGELFELCKALRLRTRRTQTSSRTYRLSANPVSISLLLAFWRLAHGSPSRYRS